MFLDLRHDKYFCLTRDQTVALVPLLAGWSEPGSKLETTRSDFALVGVLRALEHKQLITQASNGKPVPRADIASPRSDCLSELNPVPSIRAGDLLRIYRSGVVAAVNLKFRSIENTVRGVRHRRSLSKPSDAETQRYPEIVARFHFLRRYYARRHLCLFDSLALLEFLASYRMFPQWVFGVRMEPFSAHCWVQDNDVILNDTVENVRAYTPIMVV